MTLYLMERVYRWGLQSEDGSQYRDESRIYVIANETEITREFLDPKKLVKFLTRTQEEVRWEVPDIFPEWPDRTETDDGMFFYSSITPDSLESTIEGMVSDMELNETLIARIH